MQLGRFAAALFDEPEPLEPNELPLPSEPAVPDPRLEPPALDPPVLEPLPPEPTVEPLLPDEFDPLEPELEPEPELFIALLSWTCPFASRQCVAADTLAELDAPLAPLLLDPDCAEAERMPHANSIEATAAVFNRCICISLEMSPQT